MKKLLKPLKSKAMLRIAVFATLFVLMDTLIEMNKKTEEQVNYSITLENLASASGSGTYRGCPPDNPCYRGYHNHTKIIRNFSGSISSYMRRNFILPVGLSITVGASGSLTYCRRSFVLFFWEKCYKNLNGWVSFN